MRQDGKFIVNGDIPEGQGSVTALLSECFELAYELRTAAEDAEADSEDDENDDGSGDATKGGSRDHDSSHHKDLNGGRDDETDDRTAALQKAMRDHNLLSDAGKGNQTRNMAPTIEAQ